MAEIVPAAVKRQRPQNQISVQAGIFGHAHLGAVEAAQHRIEDVARGEVVQISLHEGFKSIRLFAAQRCLLAIDFEAHVPTSIMRNRQREGKARVPDVAIFMTKKKLVAPATEEGFDEVRVVMSSDGANA